METDYLMSQWTEKLDEFKEYGDDWDGESALAVRSETIATAKELLQGTATHLDYLSEIYPTPLGTVCLEWKYDGATINAEVARRRIAYYIDKFSDGSAVSEYYKAKGIPQELIDSLNASFA